MDLAVFDNTALNAGWSSFTCVYPDCLPIDRLKSSLASVLHLFPTFTGRLVKAQGGGGRYAVVCNNAGMDWITGTSRHTLEAVQPPAAGDARAWMLPDTAPLMGERLVDMLPQLYAGRNWALARASIMHLADGATTITVSVCHVLGDFASTRQLLRQWSAAFIGTSIPGPPPLPYKPALVENLAATELPQDYTPEMLVRRPVLVQARFVASAAKNWMLLGGGVTGMLSFCVSAERLRQLKEQASADLRTLEPTSKEPLWVSSNDALVARLWQVLSALPMRRGARFTIGVCVDSRGRTVIPPNAVGNFVFWGVPDACNAAATNLGQLALSVRTAILRTPTMGAHDLAWAMRRPPSSVWGSLYVPSAAGVTSNTGSFSLTNWSVTQEDASFGSTLAACVPSTQALAHHAVVWNTPQHAGMQVVSLALTRKEGKQLLKMLPGGL